MKSLVAIVMCGCLALTAAQVPGVGPCPSKIKSQSSLNVTRYLGGWYEMYRFPAVFESGQICNTANYTLKADGHIKVDIQGYKQGEYKEAIADAFAPNASEPAQLDVQFGPGAPYTPYWVIDTDYENYSLVYSCGTVLGSAAHVEFAWILSRWPQIDPPTADRLKKLLKDGGINVGFFSQTVQTNCPGRAQ